jgi:hypothetical protein
MVYHSRGLRTAIILKERREREAREVAAQKNLPYTGRGTMRSMVEGISGREFRISDRFPGGGTPLHHSLDASGPRGIG